MVSFSPWQPYFLELVYLFTAANQDLIYIMHENPESIT